MTTRAEAVDDLRSIARDLERFAAAAIGSPWQLWVSNRLREIADEIEKDGRDA